MIFKVFKTSEQSLDRGKEREVNTIEDLQDLTKQSGEDNLIINFKDMTIEIYDDYRE